MSRRAIRFWRGALAPLFLFLTVNLFAQVTVTSREGMRQERICRAGERYSIELIVTNATDSEVNLFIIQRDLILDEERVIFKELGTVERSNGSWIKVEHPHLSIKAKHRALLKIPVLVPSDAGVGSYHSVICIETRPNAKAQAQRTLGIFLRTAFQIITTIQGGASRAKISKVEVKENELWVTVENTGDNFLLVKLIPDDRRIESRTVQVYPQQKTTTKLNIEGLLDGRYKVRFILDDGKEMLIPEWIEFEKGQIPKELEESVPTPLKGERIGKRARAGKPFNLYLVLSYGDSYQGLNLAGNFRLRNFSINASSAWTEYRMTSFDYSIYRLSASYQLGWLNLGAGAYLYEDRWMSGLRAGINFKKTTLNLTYLLESESLGINFNQRLFKRFNLNFFGYTARNRNSWHFSLMIPIF